MSQVLLSATRREETELGLLFGPEPPTLYQEVDFSLVSVDYKQILLAGFFLIILGMSMYPMFSPEPVIYGAITVSFGVLIVIVVGGSRLVRQEMDREASSLHFYGFLLIGAGPAFLIYSQIARYGFSMFDWRSGLVRIYFKTPIWWIFFYLGIIFIISGVFLFIWSWRHRTTTNVQSNAS